MNEVIVGDHMIVSYLDHLVYKLDYLTNVSEIWVVAGT